METSGKVHRLLHFFDMSTGVANGREGRKCSSNGGVPFGRSSLGELPRIAMGRPRRNNSGYLHEIRPINGHY